MFDQQQFEQTQVYQAATKALDEHNLHKAWTFVQINNEAQGLGYHNSTHLMCAMGAAAIIAEQERRDTRLPVIAAMFHDMNHTGKQPDDFNIEMALSSLRTAHCRNKLELESYELHEVSDAIYSTCFMDGAFPNPPHSSTARIMRDADLWNPHLEPWLAIHMILGLGKELRAWDQNSIHIGIEKTKAFFADVVWHTFTGQEMSATVHDKLDGLLTYLYD